MVHRQGGIRVVPVLMALAALVAGCGIGSGTLRIDGAEQAILDASEAVVIALELDVPLPLRTAPREQCALRTGEPGLRSRVQFRAQVASMDVALEAASTALAGEGFVLVRSGVPGTLLLQRDGMSVTVGREGTDLALDGLTACRPR
jgi:hypothetical protein